LAGTVVVAADPAVVLVVEDGVDAPLPDVDVVVVPAAAVVDVVVPALCFAGDGEEQPARMPAAPSTNRTRSARLRLILLMPPLWSSRTPSG
jgi:hypothetical protein